MRDLGHRMIIGTPISCSIVRRFHPTHRIAQATPQSIELVSPQRDFVTRAGHNSGVLTVWASQHQREDG